LDPENFSQRLQLEFRHLRDHTQIVFPGMSAQTEMMLLSLPEHVLLSLLDVIFETPQPFRASDSVTHTFQMWAHPTNDLIYAPLSSVCALCKTFRDFTFP